VERLHRIADGEMTITHSDVPFTGIPQYAGDFHFRALKIPVAGNEQLAAGAENLTCEPLLPQIPVARLLEATFAAIVAQRDEVADATIRHIAQLALLARGRVMPGTPESRGAVAMAISIWRWRWSDVICCSRICRRRRWRRP
jgi:hypothetical protein